MKIRVCKTEPDKNYKYVRKNKAEDGRCICK